MELDIVAHYFEVEVLLDKDNVVLFEVDWHEIGLEEVVVGEVLIEVILGEFGDSIEDLEPLALRNRVVVGLVVLDLHDQVLPTDALPQVEGPFVFNDLINEVELGVALDVIRVIDYLLYVLPDLGVALSIQQLYQHLFHRVIVKLVFRKMSADAVAYFVTID